jgi:uncharacterized protein (DUF1330 family)|tara:strand:+ start:508 stop:945 length:438 start_codon:yes stop_codon:yes gene_type:complete
MTGCIDPTREAMAAFRDLSADQPIAMINLLRFRETAAYPADHASHAAALTGAEAYAAYGRAAAAPFARSGGSQIWLGRPELTLIGPADEAWDLAFIIRYETAEAFLTMVRDPEYQLAVVHRQAAVADSRLIRCQPRVAGAGFGED